jgi:hypothetical protein
VNVEEVPLRVIRDIIIEMLLKHGYSRLCGEGFLLHVIKVVDYHLLMNLNNQAHILVVLRWVLHEECFVYLLIFI